MKHLEYHDLMKLADYLSGKRTLTNSEKAAITRRLRAEMADHGSTDQ